MANATGILPGASVAHHGRDRQEDILYLEYTLACLKWVINDKAIQEIWYNSDDPIPLGEPKVI